MCANHLCSSVIAYWVDWILEIKCKLISKIYIGFVLHGCDVFVD